MSEVLKRNIINVSVKLGTLDRLEVLKLLAKNKVRIFEHSDGSRINVDLLSYELLVEVDRLIKSLLNGTPAQYRM